MTTQSCYIWMLLLIGVLDVIHGGPASRGPISFRSRLSSLSYVFPKTETATQVVIAMGFSTPKCTGNLLDIPSRDMKQHHYKLTLVSPTKLVFDYHIHDGVFNLTLKSPKTKSFCDGRRHNVILRKHGRSVTYQVDKGTAFTHVDDSFIQKPSLSKPDGVFIGGDKNDKFIGCLYNATIEIHWSKLPVTVLDLVQMYSQGDTKVSSKDLFVGACVHQDLECKPKSNKLSITRPGWLASAIAPVQQCTWVLVAPRARRVKLELYLVRVNDSCFHNHVKIMEGQVVDKQVIARYCNPFLGTPITLYSEGRFLTVVVLSLPSGKAVEFLARFTTTELSEGPCPVMKYLTAIRGSFSSPFFPYNYGNSRKCTWIIKVPRDRHVLISFKRKDFRIDGCSEDCRCDHLGVNTKIRYSVLSYRKYCGEIHPSPIYLKQNIVKVEFNSDSEDSHRGFKAHYTAIPSLEDQCPNYKELHSSSGIITSPRYPHPYPGEVDCFWVIKAPRGLRINLTFSTPLYMDPNCTDFIEVTDSAITRAQTFLTKLCSSTVIPFAFSTNRRVLFVRFVSDRYQRHNGMKHGFKAVYEILPMSGLKRGTSMIYCSSFFVWLASFLILIYIQH